jgi:hypothetical protein
VHLLAIAPQFAQLDWKDADGLAGSQWLPGTGLAVGPRHPGRWHQDGLDSLAQHLARQLALLQLRTDDDCLRFAVVRRRCSGLLDQRLEPQRKVGAWVLQRPHRPACAAAQAVRFSQPQPGSTHNRRTKNNFRHFGEYSSKSQKQSFACHPVCLCPSPVPG